MNPKDVKEMIDSYQALVSRHDQLLKKFIRAGESGFLQEDSLMERLEETERKLNFLHNAVYDSGVLTVKEEIVLEQRMDGMTVRQIGRRFSLTGDAIRKILEGSYKKLADASEKIAN